jgi:DNA polymerase III sliding clamp (beta) subunit (PCNA family)
MSDTPKYFAQLAEDDLRRVLPFRATEDVRYYLAGVYIEPCDTGGVRMIATNGHMLAVVRSVNSSAEESFILRVETNLAKEIQSSKAKPPRYLRVISRERPSQLERLSHGVGFEGEVQFIQPGPAEIDARYPDWRRVVPSDDKLKPGITQAYDAQYIVDALSLMLSKDRSGEARAARNCCAFFQEPKEPSPVVIRTQDMMALIMPMRDDGNKVRVGAPSWLELEKAS